MLSSKIFQRPNQTKLLQQISETKRLASSFKQWRAVSATQQINMATSNKIHLTVDDAGVVKFKPPTSETAAKTSELLQKNHDNHHIFFNQEGFHNHIVHHLLTLYGLGAPAEVIEKRYKENETYQRPIDAKVRDLVDMSKPENYKKHLKNEKYYHDYMVFFQSEMDKKGWQEVLKEYLFAGDERAEDLLGRMYAGFLHPLIHLGFGIEFQQPAIVAEALAQACAHDTWTTNYLVAVEKAAKANSSPNAKTLPELLEEIRADRKLSTAADWNDGNKIRDGILKRAPEEMLKYASQWSVTPENLEEKTAEMINSAVYFTAAAQNPPKQVKIDFYYMHCVNCSIFFPTLNAQSWLSTEHKVRLLQLKGYLDLAMYASRRSPELHLEEISMYTPKLLEAGDAEWKGIFQRLFNFQDDGHAVKLGRAIANGEQISKKYEDKSWCKVKGFMWEKIGNMVIDSVEDTGAHWARSVGFEEAWKEYEDRPRKSQL